MEDGKYILTGRYKYDNLKGTKGFSHGKIELIDGTFLLGWCEDENEKPRARVEFITMGLYRPSDGRIYLSKTPLNSEAYPVIWTLEKDRGDKTYTEFSGR